MKTKQLLFTLLAVIIPLASWADVWQDPVTKVNYEYSVDESEASVKAGLYSNAGSPDAIGAITILSEFTVNGKKFTVTSIGNYAFSQCSSLTSITISNSVNSIGDDAFIYCSGLTSITIPNSVTSIGERAFQSCTGLTSVTIPNSVTRIGFNAFTLCSGLTSITIPNSVTSIESGVFQNCRGLTSVTIPNSVTSIGSNAFYYCSGLTSITIPNSVTSIGNWAFQGCSSLTSVTIPNSVTSIEFGVFDGCRSLTSISIPNGVTSIGATAYRYCSSLSSVTIPNSVTSIGMNAFEGCKSLTSVVSLILEPFPIGNNVFSSYTYTNATLYVPIESISVYEETDGWKEFKNIMEEYGGVSFSLIINDENGANITDKVGITWYDTNGNQIGTGKSINGIKEGTELYYSVTFGEELGRVYREVNMQKAVVEGETITCQLKKIGRVQLEGRVSAADIDKNYMAVNIRQMLNGKWEQTYTAQTNEQGAWKVEAYDDVTDITISGDGYLDATLHRDGFGGNGNVGVIPMSLISGFSIAANISLQKAVAEGETEEMTTWSDGLNNIDFTLTNTTKRAAITDFTVQNGNVIIKTGASVGDNISLTAKSKQGVFADAATTFTIAEGANVFDLQLTELGGFDATCAVSNNGSTSGYLYNSNDVLVAKGSYVGETLSLRHLKSGVYTLVSMGNSSLLGSMTRLSDLTAVGLTAGTDYVSTRVEVVDGELTAVNVSEVPQLDERQFYYTNNNTYFSANKASVIAGNYLTLQAHVDFKQQYADKVDGVKLTIDLPEGCEMEENSVIANRQAVAHTVNGNRLTMMLNKEQFSGQVRFCVIPTLNQSYTITAMAQFDIDGQVTQPIGTAQFEVKRLSLSIPELTASTNVTINATTKGHSEVSIYDNDVLIGKTTSKADGSWTAECELYKPYSHSFHDIYAKITTEAGVELTSETQQVEYDKNRIVPRKVTMLYYNPEYVGQYNIVFDLINGTTSPSSYYFFPYKNWPLNEDYETEPKDFTFLADFTRNDSTVIKNVNIKVLNSDGTVRTLPATFDGKQNCWVATTKYSSSNKLPQNVKVEYISIPVETEFDSSRIIEDNSQFANLIKNFVTNMDPTQTEIVDANDAMIMYKYQTTTMSQPVYLRLKELNYDQWIDALENMTYFTVEDNDALLYFCDSIISENHFASWAWSKENKTLLQLELSDSREFPAISPTRNNAPRRAETFLGNIGVALGKSALNLFCGAADIAEIVNEYNAGFAEYSNWLTKYNKTLDDHMSLHKKAQQLVNAKCPDGYLKLYGPAWNSYSYELDDLTRYKAKNMREKFKNNLERVRKDLISRRNVAMTWASIGQATNLYGVLANGVAATFKEFLKDFIQDSFQGQAADNAWNMLMNNNFYTCEQLSEWYYPANKEIIDQYVTLMDNIKGSYHECEKEKDEEEEKVEDEEQDIDNNDFRGKGSTPQHDPSGYVYEAVMSNRLEGVTATCYQKVYGEDLYGDPTEEAVVWNAEDYSQVNPQKTDKTGFYRWDVPQGMWQVKYEKEGYETAYSDWLPVPPPQLDVNIGMKQSTPPTVKQMRGFESGINIEMAKYMRPETMTTANITVTRNGANEKGSIEQLNTEKAPLGEETYVSKVRFVPENRFNTTDLVVVTVHKEAESYCGVKMAKDHVETVKIEPEVKSIVCDSLLTIPYQGTKELNVMVLPKEASAGKTLHVKSSSQMIASLNVEDVTIDQNGIATLILGGELPGGAVLDYSVNGTDVTATSKVEVVMNREMVATPMANISSGQTIASGTQIVLTCSTPDATIYYTLDGSCPCNEATRHKYEGPITISTDVIVKAIAVKDDMDDSDIATFIYIVNGINDIKNAKGLKATYADGQLFITGAEGSTVRVYDLQGHELATRSRISNRARINVPKTDVYVISVTFANEQTVVHKIMAK